MSRSQVLLIEPDGLVRSTVASVCRELRLVTLHEVTSVAQGEKWARSGTGHGLLLSLAEGEASLGFLTRLRAGELRLPADLPVAVMARAGDVALVSRLKELDVRRLLLQPFRLRDVIVTLEHLCATQEVVSA